MQETVLYDPGASQSKCFGFQPMLWGAQHSFYLYALCLYCTTTRQITQISKITEKRSYENCSHCWDIFQTMFKNIFKISSYILKKTTDPINALKITLGTVKNITNIKIYLQNIPNVRFVSRNSRYSPTNINDQHVMLISWHYL